MNTDICPVIQIHDTLNQVTVYSPLLKKDFKVNPTDSTMEFIKESNEQVYLEVNTDTLTLV